MNRGLPWGIVGYGFLTAAQLSHIAKLLYMPHPPMWGNTYSDPLLFQINYLFPLACLLLMSMLVQCVRNHQWPVLVQFAIVLFVLASTALFWESKVLERDYGIPLSSGIRWLPWWASRWLFRR